MKQPSPDRRLSRRTFLQSAVAVLGAVVPAAHVGATAASPAAATGLISLMANGRMQVAYLARPTHAGPYPGIVIIHDWWGITGEVRAVADRLAADGYAVLVPDLHAGHTLGGIGDVRAWAAEQSASGAELTYRGATDYLQAQSFVSGSRVGLMAFHFGGPLALKVAQANPAVGAAVVYQGGISRDTALEGITLSDMQTAGAAAFGDPKTLFLNADSQSWERALRWFGRHLAN